MCMYVCIYINLTYSYIPYNIHLLPQPSLSFSRLIQPTNWHLDDIIGHVIFIIDVVGDYMYISLTNFRIVHF